MRKLIAPLVLAAAILIQCPAFAATPGKDLPPAVAGHVSVRSVRGFIRNLDRFVAASSKDSENEIPAGFLSMMAMIYLPVPMDDWNSDGPLNVVFLDADNPKDMHYVVFFQADDFSALAETLAESGWNLGDAVPDGNFREVRPVTVPGGDSRFLIDIGDGRIAVVNQPEDIAAVTAGDWFPEHWSDSDLHANVALKDRNNPLTRFVTDCIAEKQDELVSKIDALGLKPSFSKGVGELLQKYGPITAQEVDKIRFLLLELNLADGMATVEVGAKFEPDSLGDQVTRAIGGSGKLDAALADRVPAGAASIAISYPATRIIPEAPTVVTGLARDIVETAFPGLGEEVEGAFKEFYGSGPGQAVSANYLLPDGRTHTISYLEAERPAAAVESIVKMILALNKGWNGIITEPGQGYELVPDREDIDGSLVVHFSERYADAAKFREFLDKIYEVEPGLAIGVDPDSRTDLFLSLDDKGVIFGAGQLTKEEFAAAIRHLAAPSGESLFRTPGAEKPLGMIEHGQGSVGLLDPLGVLGVYVNAAAQAHDGAFGQPESNPFRIARDKLNLAAKESKNPIAFALGADGNWLLNRFIVPAAAVNEVAKAYDEYSKLQKEAAANLDIVSDEVEVPEEYEDDLDEGEVQEDEEAA